MLADHTRIWFLSFDTLNPEDVAVICFTFNSTIMNKKGIFSNIGETISRASSRRFTASSRRFTNRSAARSTGSSDLQSEVNKQFAIMLLYYR